MAREKEAPHGSWQAATGGHLDTQQRQNNQPAAFFQAKNGGTLTTFACSSCLEMLPAALLVAAWGWLS